MGVTLGELAARFGCQLHGDAAVAVSRVGTLAGATRDAITFLANPAYGRQLAGTRAAAVVLEERNRAGCPVASLVHPQPYLIYARIAALLYPNPVATPGVHATAVVAAGASIAPTAQIDALAAIGADATIADNVIVGAGTVVGRNASIGAGTRIAPRVVVLDGVRIGARCILHPGVVLGADGFGFAPNDGAWQKIPQVGGVVVGDDVEIGANTTIDRGAIEDTVIEDGVKIDNQVQIAHNVRVGAHTAIAAFAGIAGSTKIGRRCMIAGGVIVMNSLKICDDVMFTFGSVVTKSVAEPGKYSGQLPAERSARWQKNVARFRQLDALAQRLTAAERAVAELTEKKGPDD
jgi:UDP-3-O-[3-hydroxymyristoyl] glucosamine N-acyltransferase